MVKNSEQIMNYIAEWKKSTEYVYGYTHDFRDLDTISNAQYPKSNAKKPNVGDTTIAGTIRQIMRGSVKQMPVVGVAINGSKSTEQALICRYLVNNNILNPLSFGKGFVSTLQLGGRGALGRGFNTFQVKATKMFGEYGIIPALIHFSDIGIEPGVQDANQSSYFYVKTQFTPTKLKNIYKKEKNNKNTTWNIKALKTLIDAGPDGTGQTEYSEWLIPSEQSTDTPSETYILVTRFSSDIKQPIVSFSPNLMTDIRTVPNRSKFGYPRVLFMVIDPAELSPLGDSRVRLASPNQNLLMALRQNVVTTWLYNSDPTVVFTGLFNGATELKSGARITSTDPTAKATVLTLDTATSQQYPEVSQEITGQILTMLGYNPSEGLGAIGKSKTGAGAQAQTKVINDASQQITSIVEDFIKLYIVSGLDLLISEQDGESTIYVDDDTRDDINRVSPGRFTDPTNPNALGVNWNQLYDYIQKIDVTVDTTISKADFTNEKRADLQDALTVMKQTANPDDTAAQQKIGLVENELLDEIVPDISQQINDIQSQPTPPPSEGEKPPAESISFGDVVKAGAPRAAAAMLDAAGLPSSDMHLQAAAQDQQTANQLATPPEPPKSK